MTMLVKKTRVLPPPRLPRAGAPFLGLSVAFWFPKTPVCICKRSVASSWGVEVRVRCLETVPPPQVVLSSLPQ